jgi:predicted metal-dependent peptidase
MADFLAGKSDSEIAKIKIAAAKREAHSKCPFFAFLLFAPNYKEMPDELWTSRGGEPTMATDGENILYSVQFVKNIPIDQLIGVLIHEVLHCALLHVVRKGVRDIIKWNYAIDYATNSIITKNNISLPPGSLYDPKYNDKSAEEIYIDISKNPPNIKKVKMFDMHMFGDDKDDKKKNNGGGQSSSEKFKEQMWKSHLANAAVQARQQGKLPAGMERIIEGVLEDKIPWQQMLARYLSPFALKTDYDWCKPNKKMLQSGIVLPGFSSESLEIAVGVDTSGSISEKDIQCFLGEVRGIMSVAQSYNIHIIGCDAAANEENYHLVTECDPTLPKGLGGGGGTDFRPVFDLVEKKGIRPAVLVYFTDGYGTFPEKPPAYDVIWCVVPGGVGAEQIPWGMYVKTEFEQEEG